MMNAPIPGQSLTTPPKSFPWERPPEITKPEAAIMMHITRLQDEDRMNAILDAMEFGEIDLQTIVKGIMRSAVASGIHTIDVGLIAAPVVHEFIKQTADKLNIEYDEGFATEKEREKAAKNRASLLAQKKIKKMGLLDKKPFNRDDVEEEVTLEEVTEFEDTGQDKVKPKGLGARPEGDM